MCENDFGEIHQGVNDRWRKRPESGTKIETTALFEKQERDNGQHRIGEVQDKHVRAEEIQIRMDPAFGCCHGTEKENNGQHGNRGGDSAHQLDQVDRSGNGLLRVDQVSDIEDQHDQAGDTQENIGISSKISKTGRAG